MLSLYRQSRLVKPIFWLFIIIPTMLFLIVTLIYFIYLFWPHDISKVTSIKLNSNSSHLTLTAHGVKDSPANWGEPLQRVMQSSPTTEYINLDWRPFSNNPLVCSVNAEKIGQAIAKKITNDTQVKSIHAIGHSCGSFVIYNLCKTIKSSHPEINMQTTYLDPVSVYAGIFWDYGVKNFGNCANFSDAYIDTGDTVPGSNVALENAVTFDVTQLRINQGIKQPPHNWPPHYYIQSAKKGNLLLLHNGQLENKNFYQGELIILE